MNVKFQKFLLGYSHRRKQLAYKDTLSNPFMEPTSTQFLAYLPLTGFEPMWDYGMYHDNAVHNFTVNPVIFVDDLIFTNRMHRKFINLQNVCFCNILTCKKISVQSDQALYYILLVQPTSSSYLDNAKMILGSSKNVRWYM